MPKYVVEFADGTFADTSYWHTPVRDIDDAKVFQTKSAASKRANRGTAMRADGMWIGTARLKGKVRRVALVFADE